MSPRTPGQQFIIYEAHAQGLMHLHPEIPVEILYKALGHSVINYLKQLGRAGTAAAVAQFAKNHALGSCTTGL